MIKDVIFHGFRMFSDVFGIVWLPRSTLVSDLGGTLAHLEGQIARLRQQLQRPEAETSGFEWILNGI